MEALEVRFTVACPPDHAFAVWTRDISAWWPRGHSVSKDPALTVAIEPFAGGRVFERTAAGVEHDWGEVLAWDPPRELTYLWHIAQDRDDATEVTVSFAADGDGTQVTITQRGWERLGARGADLRGRNERGWQTLVPRYLAVAEAR
jgi:uncharacterized protein YndB with AHSA1/START domain